MTSQPLQIPGYTILSPLGQGGMAEVYLAKQNSLNRHVAIKILLTRSSENNQRFINEAHFIASLNHPHIITVYDIGTLAKGNHYIAMEYLENGDLNHYHCERAVDDAINIVKQIASALEYVHSKSIIHRDVKPENILFRDTGEAVLTDFGIAKDTQTNQSMTQHGFSIGSPSYSSPEQAKCQTLDHRTDIYSLGVVFLELLLGYNFFKGQSATETAINHIQAPLPTLPKWLNPVTPIINKMLAKSPDERFNSCNVLLTQLNALPKINPPKQKDINIIESSKDSEAHTTLLKSKKNPSTSRLNLTLIKIAAAPIILLLLFFTFIYESETDKKIKHLLKLADEKIAEHKYLAPEYDNAYYFYQQALILDAKNLSAQAGIHTANKLQITHYLKLAKENFEQGNLHKPKRYNALYFYQQVLTLDKDNLAAREGLNLIEESYTSSAKEAFKEQDFITGFDFLNRGLKLNPENKTLTELKERYKDKNNRVKNLFHKIIKPLNETF